MTEIISVDTAAGALSGRAAGPRKAPRGLIVALHGGTYDSSYYDTGAGSLLDLADPLRLRVVALDRPGYGTTQGIDPSRLTFQAQAPLLVEAIGELQRQCAPTDGTTLIGHSIGGMIALHVAATGQIAFNGIEVSGLGTHWAPGMLEMWTSFISDDPDLTVPAEPHAQVMLGPDGSYTDQQRARDADLIRPMPMPELRSVVRWTDDFPTVAARIHAPVHLTFAEHDNIWATEVASCAAATELFTHASRADRTLFHGAGHCIGLHRPSRAYTLHQLCFVEECLAESADR